MEIFSHIIIVLLITLLTTISFLYYFIFKDWKEVLKQNKFFKKALTENAENNEVKEIRIIEIERRIFELTENFNEGNEKRENALMLLEDKLLDLLNETKTKGKGNGNATGIKETDIFKEMKKEMPGLSKSLYDKKDDRKVFKGDFQRLRKNAYRRLYRKLKTN